MSERRSSPNQGAEQLPKFERSEHLNHHEQAPASPEVEQAHQERAARVSRQEIEREAESYQEHPRETASEATVSSEPITNIDKEHAYRITLRRVQSRLSPAHRSFSRVIHTRPAEKASEVLEKTIARPSGVLGAALSATAFLAVMLFFARRNGFALSGSELPMALVLGWGLGVGFEFFTRWVRRWRRR
jgi:hypothetical protein